MNIRKTNFRSVLERFHTKKLRFLFLKTRTAIYRHFFFKSRFKIRFSPQIQSLRNRRHSPRASVTPSVSLERKNKSFASLFGKSTKKRFKNWEPKKTFTTWTINTRNFKSDNQLQYVLKWQKLNCREKFKTQQKTSNRLKFQQKKSSHFDAWKVHHSLFAWASSVTWHNKDRCCAFSFWPKNWTGLNFEIYNLNSTGRKSTGRVLKKLWAI